MASTITIVSRGGGTRPRHPAALGAALQVFHAVDSACSRFNPASHLMRANAVPDRWHTVPSVLYDALVEAHRAYEQTHGRFDPRVYRDLVRLGYDHSLAFARGAVVRPEPSVGRDRLGRWRPRFRGGPRPEVHLGGVPIDLGGIGKGLAVRWAAERLAHSESGYFIDAGGDCACRGSGPDGPGWRVGVEDPRGGTDPLLVLAIRDAACATSSIRVRQWRAGRQAAHHLIDPRTGTPGGPGLIAVTVVAGDPADAEVISKVLFLSGARRIAQEAARRRIAALWVTAEGSVLESPALGRHVVWRAA